MLINISGENVAIHSIDKFMNKNSNELLIVGLIKIGEFMQVIIILFVK